MPSTSGYLPHIPRFIAWCAFAYAVLGLMVMYHYGSQYLGNPRANEMAMGFMIGFIYSSPAWLSLPVYVLARWKRLPAWERLTLLAPTVLALGAYAWLATQSP